MRLRVSTVSAKTLATIYLKITGLLLFLKRIWPAPIALVELNFEFRKDLQVMKSAVGSLVIRNLLYLGDGSFLLLFGVLRFL